MKFLLKPLVLVALLLFTISAFAEEAKPAEWLFVQIEKFKKQLKLTK